jgi:thiol-disulfide isomerase/thioredoxin
MKRLVLVAAVAALTPGLSAQTGQVIHVPLEYRAPVAGEPKPNFSPKGMQVALKPVADAVALPAGAIRPAKTGSMQLGPDAKSAMPVLVTATAEHPQDLCLLFIDRNRNGNFADDGPGLASTPTQREKTMQWWSSTSNVELSVPYSSTGATEKYFVNFWAVRDDNGPAPDIMRFSVGSWRYGTTTIKGTRALVAAMDDNNAIWNKDDMWSVVEASAPDAAKAVLSLNEARGTNRLMFVNTGSKEYVLEFRGFSPDGRSIDFAVVDKPVTKAADRKPDDMLAPERSRPRVEVPFDWNHSFTAALAKANASNKLLFVDFETTWCGPCKSMDEWIYTDAEVAAAMKAAYVGVKLDGDIDKALVKRYAVVCYPTMLVVDGAGKEVWRAVGYQSSKELLDLFAKNHKFFTNPQTGSPVR